MKPVNVILFQFTGPKEPLVVWYFLPFQNARGQFCHLDYHEQSNTLFVCLTLSR